MKLKQQLTIAFIISVLSLIGFSFMAFTISANEYLKFDEDVISLVQGWESSADGHHEVLYLHRFNRFTDHPFLGHFVFLI